MVILDTHVLLWAFSDSDRLSDRAKSIIQTSQCAVSIVSIWEIAIKSSLPDERRRLKLDMGIDEFVDECTKQSIEILPITADDCIAVQKLPFIHGDPFDRLIIAQAANRECKLVTKDVNIQKYQTVETVW